MQKSLLIHLEFMISRLHLHIAQRKCRVLVLRKIKEQLCDYSSKIFFFVMWYPELTQCLFIFFLFFFTQGLQAILFAVKESQHLDK